MKSLIKISALLLAFFFSTLAIAKEVRPYKEKVNGMTFTIDPRIEIFNIIAMQAGHNGMTVSNINYKQECLNYFSKYKHLDAPKVLKETWQKGWAIDDPMFFLLYLDFNFNLKDGLNKDIIKRGGGIKQVTKLANSIKEYAEKSNFKVFFNENQKSFYEQVLYNARYNFKHFKGVEYLEKYYGSKCNSYNLILNINGAYGNFGKQVRSNDKIDLYAIVETTTSSGNIPTYFPSISLVDLILHEFSHGFVNPITDQYKNELSKSEQLYNPIAKSMQAQAYWNWQVTVNEHVVRAIVTRITEEIYSKELNESSFYKLMIARRFIYADAIIEKLKSYEKNRYYYATFKDFAPELINVFQNISDEYITQQQNKVELIRNTKIDEIPKPYEFARDSTTYFIVGTNEKNKEKEQQMRNFVASFRDMISPKIKIITDEEALKFNLSKNDIVIFGTLNGNSFLQKHIHNIPIKITEDYIITNKKIIGRNLQLVTSWVNPFNKEKAMVIYTAQKTDNIKEFHFSAIKDQYHYWIAENTIPINTGNYEKYSRVWMPSIF